MKSESSTELLGTVIKRAVNPVSIEPPKTYRQITVKLHHRGVTLRGTVLGKDIGSTRQFNASSGQLIVSRIDARNGAIGIVPASLDGAIVSSDFWLFDLDPARIVRGFLDHYVGTRHFTARCREASEGTTNRVRLQFDQFLALTISLPPLEEQQRIVARVDGFLARICEIRDLSAQANAGSQQLLLSAFRRITEKAPLSMMGDVAPLVRRPVEIDPSHFYKELGIRSFGKGTFHKEPVLGAAIGSKRVFNIEPGDLLFSNVFAWEGAVAVAKPEDAGRIGSHRFISCVARPSMAAPDFLWFYFTTPEGLSALGDASPGGAGRNRTLGLAALARIRVPVPSFGLQTEFCALLHRVRSTSVERLAIQHELNALESSVVRAQFPEPSSIQSGIG